ncbi:MAG TPA: anti-sigma factor antagonist [Cyanobacteria bacterium UBA11049]|nr:anti-sigma factor antagonist [Cyanobacteria bacterium UBA11049]
MNDFIKVVQPIGLLTGNNAKQLRYQIDDLVNTGVNIVLVDMENVKFIDSAGLGVLIAAQRIAKLANSKVCLCSINQQVKMLFELNRMDRFFEIFIDREEFKNKAVLTESYVE